MTTVAWDGTMLAVDCCYTIGDVKTMVNKLVPFKDGVVACIGNPVPATALITVLQHGGVLPEPTAYVENVRLGDIVGLYVKNVCNEQLAELLYYDGSSRCVLAPFALGTGAPFALGAMAAGAKADKAVEIASTYDPWSGFGVDVYTVTSGE